MKSLMITCFLVFGMSFSLSAQQLDPLKIIPFDGEKYEEMLEGRGQFDSLMLKNDSLTMNIQSPYTMRIVEVPQNSMAKMPNMPIRQDVHYHMQIKKYNNCDGPEPPEVQYKLLPDQRDDSTEKPPKK
jgi:hypothetical protein